MTKQVIETFEKVKVPVKDPEDSFTALFAAKKLAGQIGFNDTNQSLIATVVSELATNILRYAVSGEILLSFIKNSNHTGIEIQAIDKGPGIENIEVAMEEKFSTTKDSLGLGLSSLKRIMDSYSINSNSIDGTKIIAVKWRKEDAA